MDTFAVFLLIVIGVTCLSVRWLDRWGHSG
jgi:hypothetical protein